MKSYVWEIREGEVTSYTDRFVIAEGLYQAIGKFADIRGTVIANITAITRKQEVNV